MQAKRLMGRVLQLASFSLAEVTYAAGDIGYQVQESVRKANYTVQARQENVSGVVLPAFEGVRSGDASGKLIVRSGAFGENACMLTSIWKILTSQALVEVDSKFRSPGIRILKQWGLWLN